MIHKKQDEPGRGHSLGISLGRSQATMLSPPCLLCMGSDKSPGVPGYKRSPWAWIEMGARGLPPQAEDSPACLSELPVAYVLAQECPLWCHNHLASTKDKDGAATHRSQSTSWCTCAVCLVAGRQVGVAWLVQDTLSRFSQP